MKRRPYEWNVQVAKVIAQRAAAGESLFQICQDEEMPGIQAVARWLREHPGFLTKYHPNNKRTIEVK